jgi:hypothetical protein
VGGAHLTRIRDTRVLSVEQDQNFVLTDLTVVSWFYTAFTDMAWNSKLAP